MTRYWHEISAGFGTMPPADPNSTVTAPGVLNVGGWTRLSGVAGNPVKSYTSTRTSSNKSTGQAEPGTAQIGLLGDNGWLDPTNTTSPYYRYLVPGVPIRSRLTDGTSFWPEWRGFAGRWPMSQSSKPDQLAVIDAYDALGWLAQATPLYPTELHRAILAAGPSSYWPHSEPAGSITVRDIVGGFDANVVGPAALGGPALTVEGVGGSVSFTNQPDAVVQPAVAAMPRPPFTFCVVVRILTYANPGPYYFAVDGSAGFSAAWAFVQDGVNPTRFATFVGTNFRLAPGLYVITVTYDLAGTLNAWVNGTKAGSTGGAFLTLPAYSVLRWGAAVTNPAPGDSAQGAQSAHIAVWPRVLADAEIVGIASAAFTSRAGETTGARIGYLLDRVAWPAAKRSIGATTMTVGPVRLAAGKSPLDLVKEAVAFEDGMLYADADANICVQGRMGTPVSSFTIGGSAAPKESAVYSTADTTVVTSAAVSDPPVLYSAGTSPVQGRVADIKQVANSVDDAFLVAQRVVQLGSTPRPGIDAVTLDPVDTPAALRLELGQVGAVTRRPIWSATDIVDTDQIISVTGTGGGGQLLKRTFGLLAPKLKQWHVHCTNNIPTGATTPHLARYDPAGVIVVEALFRVSNWATAPNPVLVAHSAGTAGYNFDYVTSAGVGFLAFAWFDNANTAHSLISMPVIRTGTRYLWGKAVFTPATGVAVFSISQSNRSAYTNWGTATFGATTIQAVSTPLTVGVQPSGNPLTGDVLAAYVNAPAATAVASFDPTADNQPGATSWAASTGETWALQGTGAIVAS